MKLEEIMKSKNNLFNGVWFKRKNKDYKIRWNYITDKFEYLHNKEIKDYCFSLDDFEVNNWEWLRDEEWYEGNFKDKYPNGVICWVWDIPDNCNSERVNCHQEIIKSVVIKENKYVFCDGNKYWRYAEPVKSDEAPAIIENK